MFDNFLCEKHIRKSKLDIRTYRLLDKCKQIMDLSSTHLKEDILNNVINNEKKIYINEKGNMRKRKHPDGRSVNNEGGCKYAVKNKCIIFDTKKLSRMEKKIFKELDYIDFLENNKTVSDKLYKKIILKKFSLRIAAPLILLLLLSVSMILDFFGFKGIMRGLYYVLKIISTGWYQKFHKCLEKSFLSPLLKSMNKMPWKPGGTVGANGDGFHRYVEGFFGYIIYFLPFLILGVTVILAIIIYHKKVKKYQKIKFGKR
ncbi:Plasmodium exported protein (Pm-fam-a like), unknown function [Plasmodium malariae]|uniref:Fam-l protein n=1 Tax=Plasmodium malariae TaxID=5858 RepID=A0A1A8WTB5_PLAMA|nr:Plasmodium exported protein (Pm-fam-a like), unknown function [Plasmodium malariae]